MSWVTGSQIRTASDKLAELMERNRAKARKLQEKAIAKAEKDDLKAKYSLNDALTTEEKKALKDYIISINEDILNPSEDENYEPPQIPGE